MDTTSRTPGFKLFAKRVILFFLPVILVFAVIEVLVRHVPNDYSYKNDWLEKNSDSVEVLVLGSSHSFFGINTQYLKGGFNAAYTSQSLKYDWAIVRKYSWKKLKVIVLPVDYLTLFYDMDDGPEPWKVRNYNIYYGFNNYNFYDNFEIFNSSPNLNIKRIMNYYLDHKSRVTVNETGSGNGGNAAANLDSGFVAAKRHTAKTDKHFKDNLAYFDSIINFRKTLVITCPAYKSYYSVLDTVQLERTYEAIKQRNVAYHNFLKDTSFVAEDFSDPDHMSEKGAIKLTAKLNQILYSLERQPGNHHNYYLP